MKEVFRKDAHTDRWDMQFEEAGALEVVGYDGDMGRIATCLATQLEEREENVLIGVCGVGFGCHAGLL